MTEKYRSREERRRQSAANKQKTATGKKRFKKIFKRIFITLVILGIAGLLTGVATFAYLLKDSPKLDETLLIDPISSKILDKDGNFVRELGIVRRDYVEYEDIPEIMVEAVLATEDSRFFKHSGVDFIRLGGAVIANITGGFGSEGASTITQQLVKNSFLTQEKTLKRKAQEAWLSIQLERRYTKEEIFEMYVNKNNMAGNVHGIATASKVYFGKDLEEVNVEEAALLAGLFQSPNRYNPFKYPEQAEKRRNVVLSLMNHHGFISENEMETAKKISVEDALVPEEKRETDQQPYDSFIDYVINEIQELGDYNVFADGLTVYTTLDTNAQKYVEKILDTNEVIKYPDKDFQAGITLLDTRTGGIRALGGGRNQTVQRGYSFATDIQRPPGSTIKPVLDYGPAIEYLKWSTYQQIKDEPYTYSNGTPINNWDRKHMGTMTIREALGRSRNIPALKALQAVGLDKAQEFAKNIGIPFEDDEIFEPYSIGGFKTGVSPLQLAGAYSAFGNNGMYTKPFAVEKIELKDGTIINTTPETKVAMKDYTAFMITDILKGVLKQPYGTGVRANIPHLHVAGKTGTTNYAENERIKYGIPRGAVPDAWFVGYTTNYTSAVWTGYKEKNKNYIPPGDSQRIAMMIFKNLMEQVSKDINTPDFTVPSSVVKVGIEKGSNPPKLPGPGTPSSQIVYEYFVKGSEPNAVSEKYSSLPRPSNLQGKYDELLREIALAWDYKLPKDQEETDEVEKDEKITFEVQASIDGGEAEVITVTDKTKQRISNIELGKTYTFQVTALRGELRSEPASITITVPGDKNDGITGDEGENNDIPHSPPNGPKDQDKDKNDEKPGEDGKKPPQGDTDKDKDKDKDIEDEIQQYIESVENIKKELQNRKEQVEKVKEQVEKAKQKKESKKEKEP